MDKKIFFRWSLRDLMVAVGPVGAVVIVFVILAGLYLDPAPPNHLTIATGDADQTDLAQFAKEYQAILKEDGVRLDIQATDGPFENLKILEKDSSGVSVAFVQDGLGSAEKQPDIESLGSLYYEPIWIFYRGNKVLSHLSQLDGKKISVGRVNHGTNIIAKRLLKLSGVDMQNNARLVNLDSQSAVQALKKGEIDAAFFLAPPESPIIHDLLLAKGVTLFDNEQAEGVEKNNPSFHHLVLARGAIDLKNDLPNHDVDLLATTNTLLIRDDLHPALQFLLLKAAGQLHSDPGVFEHRAEFPSNKADVFPLSSDARQYYKSGGPFWQRYLPYWLAAWVDRFIFLVIPFLAILVPMIRTIPKIYYWRIRQRIYRSYGELKFLETQLSPHPSVREYEDFLIRLDAIEARVNTIKVPQNFAEYIYSLRGHIQFVRDRLSETANRIATPSTVLSILLGLVLPFILLTPALSRAAEQAVAAVTGASDSALARQRVTSIYLSQKFLNEQLKAHVKTEFLKDLTLELDPKEKKILLKGLVQVPIEELKAVNLDPKLGAFRFQLTIKAKATRLGYLILVLPLNETYFYPAASSNPLRDRIIVPVQMLSLALASARGYFAALSGDFSSLDRSEKKYRALIHALDRSIASEKNPDAIDEMTNERDALKLKLVALPIERKQLRILGKQLGGLMAFSGEKEINLNDEFSARRNAIILKLDLQKFTPYLQGVELGGIRIVHDNHDGKSGENYFSVDINARQMAGAGLAMPKAPKESDDDEGLDVSPAAMIRINQAMFESELVVSAQQKAMGSKLTDLKLDLKNDGLHVTGKYHKLFFAIPFDTIVDFDSSETDFDSFDISVRQIQIAGIDLDFLTSYVLETMKVRLDQSLQGICTFQYIGEKKDHTKALRVTMDPKKLIPALPDLHIVDVDVRDREFLFKVGHK